MQTDPNYHVYTGERKGTLCVVERDGKALPVEKACKYRHFKARQYEWGYHGSPPLQLAFTILLCEFGREIAERLYCQLEDEQVSKWGTRWRFDSDDALRFLKAHEGPKENLTQVGELF